LKGTIFEGEFRALLKRSADTAAAYLPNRRPRGDRERLCANGQVAAARGVDQTRLELGIDIGALDVSVMAGLSRQRSPRPGKRAGPRRPAEAGRSAAVVMVASSAGPLDQFVVRKPVVFFSDASARSGALIDPDKPAHPRRPHQVRATFELAVHRRTKSSVDHDVQEILGILSEQGLVHPRRRRTRRGTWNERVVSGGNAVSLRSVSSDNFRGGRHHARNAGSSAKTDYTSGPGYPPREGDLHRRRPRSTRSSGLDFEGRKGLRGARIDCDYYTTAITYTKSHGRSMCSTRSRAALKNDRRPQEGRTAKVHVRCRAVGRLQEDQVSTRTKNIGSGELDLPEQQDAHDLLLADDSGRRDGAMLPLRPQTIERDGVVGLAGSRCGRWRSCLLMCDGHDYRHLESTPVMAT